MALIFCSDCGQRISRYAGRVSEAPDNRYSAINIVAIILGSLLQILALVGSLIPDEPTTS